MRRDMRVPRRTRLKVFSCLFNYRLSFPLLVTFAAAVFSKYYLVILEYREYDNPL